METEEGTLRETLLRTSSAVQVRQEVLTEVAQPAARARQRPMRSQSQIHKEKTMPQIVDRIDFACPDVDPSQ